MSLDCFWVLLLFLMNSTNFEINILIHLLVKVQAVLVLHDFLMYNFSYHGLIK